MWNVDPWHQHTRRRLSEILTDVVASVAGRKRLLHLGSAGADYGINGLLTVHIDVAENLLRNVACAVVADAESLPLASHSFDCCVCVGSVLNHCDAATVIGEISRTLTIGGRLVLEFETSDSWEFLLSLIHI